MNSGTQKEEFIQKKYPVTDNKATFTIPDCSWTNENEDVIFTYWHEKSSFSCNSSYPGETYNFDSPYGRHICFFAVWLNKSSDNKICYHPDNGNSTDVYYSYYDKNTTFDVSAIENPYTNTGSTFLGWTDIKNSKKVKYLLGEKINIYFDAPTDLYAVWEEFISITLSENSNRAKTNVLKNISTCNDFTIPPQTDFEYEDRTLAGWSKNKDDYIGSETFIDKTSSFTPTEEDDGTTYYAIWTKKITVPFKRGNSIESDKNTFIEVELDSNKLYNLPHTEATENVIAKEKYNDYLEYKKDSNSLFNGYSYTKTGTAIEQYISKSDSTFVVRENLKSIEIMWDEPAVFLLYETTVANKPKKTEFYYSTVVNTPYPAIPECPFNVSGSTFDHWVDQNGTTFGSTSQPGKFYLQNYKGKTTKLYAVWN